jgi:hypothetical protein
VSLTTLRVCAVTDATSTVIASPASNAIEKIKGPISLKDFMIPLRQIHWFITSF